MGSLLRVSSQKHQNQILILLVEVAILLSWIQILWPLCQVTSRKYNLPRGKYKPIYSTNVLKNVVCDIVYVISYYNIVCVRVELYGDAKLKPKQNRVNIDCKIGEGWGAVYKIVMSFSPRCHNV